MSFADSLKAFIGLDTGKAAPSGPEPVRSITRTATAAPKPRRIAGDMSEIYTVEMSSFADCKEVSDNFRLGIPVIVNMAEMSELDSRRMLDFMLGLKEGLEGHIKRVTPKVFLLTPNHVAVNNEEDEQEPNDDLLVRP